MTEPKTEIRKKIEDDWDDLFFGVKRTVRYHLHRRKFFSMWKVVVDFLVIATGGTVVSLASSEGPKKNIGVIVAGAITAIVGTLDLVIGFSDKARDHRDLVEKFSELEADMVRDAVAKVRLAEFTNKRLKLEVDEPPRKVVLNKYCHNELVIAMDYPAIDLADIKWWQSWPKQFIDICPQRVRTFRQIESARLAKVKTDAAAATPQKSAQIQA